MNRTESENDIEQILSEIENKAVHEYWETVRTKYAGNPEFQETLEDMETLVRVLESVLESGRPPEPGLRQLNGGCKNSITVIRQKLTDLTRNADRETEDGLVA